MSRSVSVVLLCFWIPTYGHCKMWGLSGSSLPRAFHLLNILELETLRLAEDLQGHLGSRPAQRWSESLLSCYCLVPGIVSFTFGQLWILYRAEPSTHLHIQVLGQNCVPYLSNLSKFGGLIWKRILIWITSKVSINQCNGQNVFWHKKKKTLCKLKYLSSIQKHIGSSNAIW